MIGSLDGPALGNDPRGGDRAQQDQAHRRRQDDDGTYHSRLSLSRTGSASSGVGRLVTLGANTLTILYFLSPSCPEELSDSAADALDLTVLPPRREGAGYHRKREMLAVETAGAVTTYPRTIRSNLIQFTGTQVHKSGASLGGAGAGNEGWMGGETIARGRPLSPFRHRIAR